MFRQAPAGDGLVAGDVADLDGDDLGLLGGHRQTYC
jgi:hypothetical protein